MTEDTAAALTMTAGAFALAALATYGLAIIGEPQSAWLWCDLIGLCPGGDK